MVMRFDVSSIPAAATITSAKLDLYCVRHNGERSGPTTWAVYPLRRAWVDASVTWNNASTGVSWPAGGDIGAKYGSVQTPYGVDVWKSFDVTAAVAAFVRSPDANYGILIAQENSSNSAGQFISSDNSDAAHRPKLTVTYTGVGVAVPAGTRLVSFSGGATTAYSIAGRTVGAKGAGTGMRVLVAGDARKLSVGRMAVGR